MTERPAPERETSRRQLVHDELLHLRRLLEPGRRLSHPHLHRTRPGAGGGRHRTRQTIAGRR